MSVTVVIPCFNEEDGIPSLIDDLTPVLRQMSALEATDVLFVDDGSRDATARLLDRHRDWPVPTRIVRHDVNRGLGAAIRTGFGHATGDRIVVTDADGTYDFRTLPRLLELLHGDVAIVTASPYHPRGGVEGVPAYRLVLSRGASTLYRILVDPRIHTYTAMYRAYRADVARSTPFDADGFLSMAELLINAVRAGHRVAEYPAVLRVRRYGQSKARSLQIVRAHLRLMARILRTRGGPVSRRRPTAL